MHDYLLSVINDTIDQDVHREIVDFHIKGNNRIENSLLPFAIIKTLLNDEQIEALQMSEHPFGEKEYIIGSRYPQHCFKRRHSAESFEHLPPLDYDVFCTTIYNSFAASPCSSRLIMPYPSGGAMYSGQIIVFIKNVDNIEQGAYHYLPITSKLERLDSLPIDIVEKSLFLNFNAEFINYDFFVFYGSLITKHICKYGSRGYRLGVMEIGSMYRNMEIQAANSHLQSRIWGGFMDESLAASLGIDPRVVFPMVCQLIGRVSC